MSLILEQEQKRFNRNEEGGQKIRLKDGGPLYDIKMAVDDYGDLVIGLFHEDGTYYKRGSVTAKPGVKLEDNEVLVHDHHPISGISNALVANPYFIDKGYVSNGNLINCRKFEYLGV
jgi:hypothetical protein